MNSTRFRSSLAVLGVAAAAALVLIAAGPASAGGPTSVLLVEPGAGRTAALYTSSADYERLVELVGAYGPPAGPPSAPEGGTDGGPAGTEHESGPGVTLTWMAHDVSVWRVDRVFPDAAGGPWISTMGTLDSGIDWEKAPLWHTSSDGKALKALLDRLVLSTAPVSEDASAAVAPAGPASPTTVIEKVSNPKTVPLIDPWTAGIGGVVLGAALALVLTRLLPRKIQPA
jgi:hypothetical protein